MRKSSLAIVGVALILAGCGGATPEAAQSPTAKKPDISNIQIEGDRDLPVNQLAMEAIADLQTYWGEQYPTLYGEEYKPVEGGLFALTSEAEVGPECASSFDDVSGNAFYCKLDDSVTWDAEGLLPDLKKKYGDFVIPVVLAHEWGHAIQQRSGFFDQNQVTASSELQADCFAGAWAKHAQADGVFDVDAAGLDKSLAGILSVADSPGTTTENTRDAHGSGFDRVSAFQDGYDNDLEKCKGYKDGDPMVLELPFSSEQDEANNGNAPYDTTITSVPYDLEDYWSQAFPQIADGQAWTPTKGQVLFDPSDPPTCGGTTAEGYSLFYCVPDDYVGFDNVDIMPSIYDEGGDWAVATLLATQWGLGVQSRMGDDLSDVKTTTARADCMAGAYTVSVLKYDREQTSTLTISPGDLDEGIKALLLFRADGDVDRQGAGFDRVRAFREGVLQGPDPCVTYQN